jgi:hypothetical protein
MNRSLIFSGPSFSAQLSHPMRPRESESLLLLPLLPIFLIGVPPMLLLSFLGFLGLVILGVLLICVGLSGRLDASDAYNQHVIVQGYARGSERATQASNLRSDLRFSNLMDVAGAALIAVGIGGFFVFD